MASSSRKEQLEAMLADEPNDPLLRYMLAMEHVSAGDDAGAVDCFRDLLARAADYVPGYMQFGQALCRTGKIAEAREVWQRGIIHAQRQGNDHAAGEMQGMVESLE
jgi:predicted Zn-dependent protease